MTMVSVVVPVCNEQAVLPELQRRLLAVLASAGVAYEIVYVDDGSTDDSVACIHALREEEPGTALLELSRNFGKEVAISAGLDCAQGDAVVVIDADLQDPPELITELLQEWQAGYDVVYAVRESREGESWLKVFSAYWFYRVMNRLSDVEIPADAGDYRLLSRRAVDALKTLHEKHRYMKGLYAWVGFPQKGVPYRREARAAGRGKWNYWRLWNFALEGITSFSAAPLKLATYLGLLTSTLAFLYGAYILLRTLFLGNPVPGYPSLMVIILFLGGVQLICLGIIGEYLARTFNESKQRTLYFVKGFHPSAVRGEPAPQDTDGGD